MQVAEFTLESYRFLKVVLDMEAITPADELLVNFKPSGVYLANSRQYKLTMEVSVAVEDKGTEFAYVKCEATYLFSEHTAFDTIPDYFYSNAIAILFPYVRAYLSILSTQANIKGIILPTLNLTALQDDLRRNTTIQNS